MAIRKQEEGKDEEVDEKVGKENVMEVEERIELKIKEEANRVDVLSNKLIEL